MTISFLQKSNCISLLQLGIFCILKLSTQTSSGSQEPCNNLTNDCNSTAGLKCLDGVCQCMYPEAQIYSEQIGACRTKIGRRCGIYKNYEEKDPFPFPPCIDNAECRKLKRRNWCSCKEGFTANIEATQCVSVAKYGESCENNKPCEKRSGTECISGKCQCPDKQFFEETSRQCYIFANGNCTMEKASPCVRNAECVNTKLMRTGFIEEGVKKVHYRNVTQCHCSKGYAATNSGFCMGMAGANCSKQNPCNSEAHLACVDGKCKCRNPLHETINEKTGQCVSLVGSKCQSTDGGIGCVENSVCVESQCKCIQGYEITINKTCLLGNQQSCAPNQCNGNAGLACINGRCQCFDSHLIFVASQNACVGVMTSRFGS